MFVFSASEFLNTVIKLFRHFLAVLITSRSLNHL
nr:MAG TPA: hypothetical protein [Caudoviricetes sp.]